MKNSPESLPIWVFIFAFLCSTLAGIAAYLRAGKKLTPASILTAGLNSGLLGLSVSFIWYQRFKENITFLLGICIVIGLTGAGGLEFFLNAIQKGGISINFGNKDDNENKDKTKIDFN